MDQVTTSTYFVIVVFLQNNAEITVLHTVLNVLALKKKPNQPLMVKRKGRKKCGKPFRN